MTNTLGESSVSSAATVVTSTWDLLYNPDILITKIKKAAGKVNKPSQKQEKMTWDLAYLWLYIGGDNCGSPDTANIFGEDFKSLMEETICLVKGATGWRSDDIAGMYLDYSLQFTALGVYISNYDSKVGQRVHSTPFFLASLSPEFARIDVVCALRRVNDYVTAHKSEYKLSEIKDKHGNDAKAAPLFTHFKSKFYFALKSATIGNYFKRAFLDNVSDGPDSKPLSADHTPHTSRHAVASLLSDMGVATSAISTLTLNKPATLAGTYIIQVFRSYKLPEECIKAQKQLHLKLLIPYVHWHTSTKDGDKNAVEGSCRCSALQLQ